MTEENFIELIKQQLELLPKGDDFVLTALEECYESLVDREIMLDPDEAFEIRYDGSFVEDNLND